MFTLTISYIVLYIFVESIPNLEEKIIALKNVSYLRLECAFLFCK